MPTRWLAPIAPHCRTRLRTASSVARGCAVSRAFFSPWGRRLDDREFADALAALGALQNNANIELHHRGEAQWDLAPWRYNADEYPDARSLAETWRKRASQIAQTRPDEPPEVRLVVRGAWRLLAFVETPRHARSTLGLGWLSRTLSSATAVGAVRFDIAPPNPLDSWDWPLDVAPWEPSDAPALVDAFRKTYWRRFVRVHEPGEASGQIDLLLVSGGVPDALARAVSHGAPARVHTVLLDTAWQPGGYDDLALLDALRGRLGAATIVLCPAKSQGTVKFADELLLRLSHDSALDAALFAGTRWAGWSAPFLAGRDGAFAAASISTHLQPRLEHLARAAPPLAFTRAKPPAAAIPPPPAPLPAVAREVAAALPGFAFGHESEEATELAELTKAIDATLREAPEQRFLQARLFDIDGEGEKPVQGFLRTDADHRLDVRVGAQSADWLAAPEAFPAPAAPASILLTVVFTEPSFAPEPQIGRIVLPTVGDSTPAAFHFRTHGEAKQFDGRVTVLHRNRVLQTVRIRAGVGSGDAAKIELESVIRSAIADVDWRPEFSAALVLNDNATAGHAATILTDDHVSYFRIEGLKTFVDAIRKELERVTDDPAKFVKLRSSDTEDLIGNLARQGRLLLQGLLEMPQVSAGFDGEGALQIVSLEPEGNLPIEFCYDRPAPDLGAKLCPGAEHALEEGQCDASCASSRTTVCPLGFWGMRRVIERHAYDRALAGALGANNYAVVAEARGTKRRLNVLGAVLCAASANARIGDEDTITPAFKAIADRAGARTCPVTEVTKWTDWSKGAKNAPGVLLLVSHVEKQGGVSALEIGEADFLAQTTISDNGPDYVGLGAPLVFLLGCRTATAVAPFNSVVTNFRRAGAPAIFAALADVRGRHMGPIADRLVQYVTDAALVHQPATLGELMMHARRELLRTGYPIVLSLTAFGDADWRL
jgi:hypothetical protein